MYFWSGSGTNYLIIISFIGALIPWGSTTPLKAVGRTWDDLKDCQAVILAVPHREYLALNAGDFGAMMVEDATLVDIKSVLDRGELDAAGLNVWRV